MLSVFINLAPQKFHRVVETKREGHKFCLKLSNLSVMKSKSFEINCQPLTKSGKDPFSVCIFR